jgi:hypothetical protein
MDCGIESEAVPCAPDNVKGCVSSLLFTVRGILVTETMKSKCVRIRS